MTEVNYFKIIKKHWQLLAAMTIAVVLVSLLITAFLPFKYRSTVQLLVIENQAGWDAYSAIRSAEQINSNLAYLINTTSFRDKVLHYGFVRQDSFPVDPLKRQKAWVDAISTYAVPQTGILKIDIYHRNQNEATAIAKSVAYGLVTSGREYLGSSQVEIKIVDEPLTSRYPVKPNVPLNLGAALVLGALLSVGYVLAFNESLEKKSRLRAERLARAAAFKPDFGQVESPIELPKEEDNLVAVPVFGSEQELAPVAVEAEPELAVVSAEDKESDFYKMLFPERE